MERQFSLSTKYLNQKEKKINVICIIWKEDIREDLDIKVKIKFLTVIIKDFQWLGQTENYFTRTFQWMTVNKNVICWTMSILHWKFKHALHGRFPFEMKFVLLRRVSNCFNTQHYWGKMYLPDILNIWNKPYHLYQKPNRSWFLISWLQKCCIHLPWM